MQEERQVDRRINEDKKYDDNGPLRMYKSKESHLYMHASYKYTYLLRRLSRNKINTSSRDDNSAKRNRNFDNEKYY